MENKCILNNDILNDPSFNISTKVDINKRNHTINYFLYPNISIQLFAPKVSWIELTANKYSYFPKNISLSFNRHENLNLLGFLRNVQKKLQYIHSLKSESILHSFFYEKGDYFYIKCYLPNLNNKYLITSNSELDTEVWKVPRLNCSYTSVILDIKNIWENKLNSGINLELVHVNY